MRSTLSIGRPAVAQRKIWGVETASSRLALFLQEPKKTCDKTHKIHKYSLNPKGAYSEKNPRTPLHNTIYGSK